MNIRSRKKPRLRVIVPTGPEMIRVYHRNIVANDVERSTPRINVPSILTRAKLVVRESREIVIRDAEGDQ